MVSKLKYVLLRRVRYGCRELEGPQNEQLSHHKLNRYRDFAPWRSFRKSSKLILVADPSKERRASIRPRSHRLKHRDDHVCYTSPGLKDLPPRLHRGLQPHFAHTVSPRENLDAGIIGVVFAYRSAACQSGLKRPREGYPWGLRSSFGVSRFVSKNSNNALSPVSSQHLGAERQIKSLAATPNFRVPVTGSSCSHRAHVSHCSWASRTRTVLSSPQRCWHPNDASGGTQTGALGLAAGLLVRIALEQLRVPGKPALLEQLRPPVASGPGWG